MEKYREIKKIGDGAFGSVIKAENIQDKSIVAIKYMKQKYKSWDECMELRELKSLRKLKDHINIIRLKEVIRVNDELAFIFEFIHNDIFRLYEEQKKLGTTLPKNTVKSIFWQTANALQYCHKQGFFHRDLKPENIFISENQIVKLGDFGLAREIRSRPPFTEYVSTRWYRAPEIILRQPNYNSPVDVFALGCIIGELYEGKPIFPGGSEIDQLTKYCQILGTPSKEEWPEGHKLAAKKGFTFRFYSSIDLQDVIPNAPYEALQLIKQCLQWDPNKRPNATKIMQHQFFNDINSILPQEVQQAMLKGGIVPLKPVTSQQKPTSQSSNTSYRGVSSPLNKHGQNELTNKRLQQNKEKQSNRENFYGSGQLDLDDILGNSNGISSQKKNQDTTSFKKPPLRPSNLRENNQQSNNIGLPKLDNQSNNLPDYSSRKDHKNKDIDSILDFLNKPEEKRNSFKNDNSINNNYEFSSKPKFPNYNSGKKNEISGNKNEYEFNHFGSEPRRNISKSSNPYGKENPYHGSNNNSNLNFDFPQTTTKNNNNNNYNFGSYNSIQQVSSNLNSINSYDTKPNLSKKNLQNQNSYGYSNNNYNYNYNNNVNEYKYDNSSKGNRATSLNQNLKPNIGGNFTYSYNPIQKDKKDDDILGQYLPSTNNRSRNGVHNQQNRAAVNRNQYGGGSNYNYGAGTSLE
ncbi:Protein kinase-like domain [Pseudocohnilembus persalinus]|uniref:Protein kinase-like domain n=1 Tax=Pseudocohnilembus persalinus TaxID=266149 RepID=A0A0V0R950_PSEPJ|nr:Protein kinase-like domain [Pseudocohnilembus persalinus]|eukprot:KRX11019.1 Protein kinase-like domain [Pseudocohnilembus persalinus]